MKKLITESYNQFLLEKNIDMIATLLNAFEKAGYPAELDKSLKAEIDNKGLNATIDLVVDFKGTKDFISTSILSGVVYWADFSKNVKLGEITDEKGLVKGIQKVFK
jgi:hypothetical protein